MAMMKAARLHKVGETMKIEQLPIPEPGQNDVLVRVHSGCVTGDILGSLRCDCGDQLEAALRQIEAEGRGVLVYLPEHEGRGIGLLNKIKAYAPAAPGRAGPPAGLRAGSADPG